MSKYLPSILAVLGLLATSFSSQIQAAIVHYVSAHPALSVLYASAYAILSHILPSPVAPAK